MLLAIDAGNSNIVFAVFDGNELKAKWRVETGAADYDKAFQESPENITGAVIACVVPKALAGLQQFCREHLKVEPLVVTAAKAGIPLKIENPETVGVDRVVNAFAAWKKYGEALIVVDMGTATTFDVVNEKGEFIGGAIAPGAKLALEALRAKAGNKLPDIALEAPASAIGKNTAAAMQSGMYYGYAGLVEGLVSGIKEALFPSPFGRRWREASDEGGAASSKGSVSGEALTPALSQGERGLKVIATGGLAALYAKACPSFTALEPDLMLLGLKDIFEMNT